MAVVSSSNNYLLNNTFVINQDTVGATDSPQLFFLRDHGSGAAIAGGDFLFQMVAVASDGTNILPITSIESVASATVGTNQIGGNLLFYTTADTHLAVPGIRMQISDAGNVTINTPVSGVGLTINGGGLTSTGTTTLSSLSYGVLVAGATGVISAPVGTINYVLTSNGAGASPTFQALPASGISLTGDSGGALGPASSFTITGSTSGAVFAGSGTTLTESFNYLALPTTDNAGNGQIKINNIRFLHSYGSVDNTFVGSGSGNFTLTGTRNTVVGANGAGTLLTSGTTNCIFGDYALYQLSSGSGNVAIGSAAGFPISTQNYNICIGYYSGNSGGIGSSNIYISNNGNADNNTIRIGTYGTGNLEQNKCYIAACYSNYGTNNTFSGELSGNAISTAQNNTGCGYSALGALTTGSGGLGQNTAVGAYALSAGIGQYNNSALGWYAGINCTGQHNLLCGAGAGYLLTNALYNTILGTGSGNNYTSTESSNIMIGASILGVTGESNKLRIGLSTGSGNGQLNKSWIQGIYGITPDVAGPKNVVIDSAGQLGTNSSVIGSWVEVTGTTQAIAVGTGYILNNVALVTATLPATSAVGDVVELVGKGTGLWSLAQNANQIVHLGNTDTSTGVGGSLTATNRYDSLSIVCTVASLEWTVKAVVGNLTVA